MIAMLVINCNQTNTKCNIYFPDGLLKSFWSHENKIPDKMIGSLIISLSAREIVFIQNSILLKPLNNIHADSQNMSEMLKKDARAPLITSINIIKGP